MQGLNELAGTLTSILKTNKSRSAKNLSILQTWLRMLSLDAEQASKLDMSKTRYWTWLTMVKIVVR